MYCIRERKNNKLLGVSFTEDGLKFIANKLGKVLLYRNANFVTRDGKVLLAGDLRPNPDVYITKYSRIIHNVSPVSNTMNDAWKAERSERELNKIEDFWEKAIDLKRNYPNYYYLKSNRNGVKFTLK